jgi:hypothetical protein
MFAALDWMMADPTVPAQAVSEAVPAVDVRGRSRSPAPAARAGTPAPAGAAAEFPVTGLELTETWFQNNVSEPQIMTDFMELPQWRRKTVILKCIEKPPDNVHSWLVAVIRNFRTSELEKRLTGMASVHGGHGGRSLPPAAMSIPPGGLSHATGQETGGRGVSTTLPLATTPRSRQQGEQPGATPKWAIELIAFWPGQKSRLVAHFLPMLQPATQAKVVTMPPQTLACIAMALALTARSDTAVDAAVCACLQRLQPAPAAVSEAAAPAATGHRLQLILLAPESLVSLVFVKSFVHAMERLAAGAFTYLPLVFIPTETSQDVSEEAQRLKLTVNTSAKTLPSLETFIDGSKVNFGTHKIKTLFVSMLHAGVAGAGGDRSGLRGAAALHGDGLRFLWTVARCSEALRAVGGDDSVAELVFAPPRMETLLAAELTKLVGPTTATANATYNGVACVPTVFATPRGCAIVKVCQGQDYAPQAIDGWRLSAEPVVPEDANGRPIDLVSKAAEINVFQERPLTPVEQKVLDTFTMAHEQTGERRLCSRDWWLRWYGYHKTPLNTVLDARQTCTPIIYSVTGSAAAADAPGGEPCGKQRMCVACEQALRVLDATYCLPVMVDAAVAVVVKAQQLWSSGAVGAEWSRADDVNRVHNCGRACPFAV